MLDSHIISPPSYHHFCHFCFVKRCVVRTMGFPLAFPQFALRGAQGAQGSKTSSCCRGWTWDKDDTKGVRDYAVYLYST